jgi:hypothetical protein
MRNRVELGPELEPAVDDEAGSEKLKPCKTLRAIVAERMCLNVTMEERREPAGTGVGVVRSRMWP